MATANKRRFSAQAVWYFLRQDYPARELIVVDDGVEAVGDYIPQDERIRYVRIPHAMSPAEKYAAALQLAQGELIAHWSDDDWMGEARLREQIDALLESQAVVCGISGVLVYHLERGQAWYHASAAHAMPVRPETMLYHRSSDLQLPPEAFADGSFLRQLPPDRIQAISDPSFYMVVAHAGKNIPINAVDPSWQQRPFEAVNQRLGFDRTFYASLRHGARKNTVSKRDFTRVTIAAPFMVYDGYGSMAECLVLAMARAGAEVDVVPLRLDNAGLSAEFQQLLAQSHADRHSPTLIFSWPEENFERFRDARDMFIYTMWETSRAPSRWIERLRRARALIVPSKFVATVFRDSGITTPIEVVPHGLDPAVYHYAERPQHAGLTTLMVGVFVPRKNMLEGVAAWKQAFAGDPDARLIIKSRFNVARYEPDDPRIQFIDSMETTRGIADWYARADILMALGNEGFGLPLIESMATGMTVIALNSEGQADVCEAAPDCLLTVSPARWTSFNEPPFGDCGVRAVPSIDEIAERLRWIASNREAARAMGRRAAAWVAQNRTMSQMGAALLDVMERYGTTAQTLRRLPIIWQGQPDDGGYSEQLARHLPSVRVVNRVPDLRNARLIHIQHQEGLFDEQELMRTIQQAHYSGIPVIVTAHQVGAQAHAWEREVDRLVVHTPEAAETLRARWPDQNIDYAPFPSNDWQAAAVWHTALWRSV